MNDGRLVTAAELEIRGILRRHTAYKMARSGKLPCYQVGVRGTGLRFRVDEVLLAIRRPEPACR